MMNLRFRLPALFVFFVSVFASAHPGGRDSLGCHRDKTAGNYHCHEGVLAGRAFASKAEAQAAFDEQNKTAAAPAPAPEPVPAPEANPDDANKFTVISWNVKKMGHKNLDVERIAMLLSDADLITFQEVNKGGPGQDAVRKIMALLSTREKMCWALSDPPSGALERYAYIWKNKKIAYVKTDGSILEDCTSSAVEVALDVKAADKIIREPALGTFYDKTAKRKFTFASIHLVPTQKRPQDEVPPLFESFDGYAGPLIIAGDFNLRPWHESFMIARQMKFLPALKLDLTSLKSAKRELNAPYDNFWYRELKLESKVVINLYDAFPNVPEEDIFNKISDHCPIKARFSFVPAPAP